MAVRETLELDLRAALSSLGALDRQLVGTARQFSTELNRGIGDLNKSLGGLGSGANLGPLQKEIDATTQKQRENEEQTKRNDASLSRLGTTAGIAGAAIAAGIGIAIAASINFERELSTVAAVTDATGDALGKLREAAIQAGAATVFSASDAARAEAELAKAGLSVKDILGGALTGALNLASAGQLELADAATIAAQAMSIFKLQGGDVSHIADVLAAGANKSTASVASLGEGLGNIGGAASLAGLSLEETVGVLALLDQNAVRGAEGGTALRSMLVALFGPTDKAKTEMERLGINVYDTQGRFIGLEGVAGQLQKAFIGVDDATRNASLSLIFGTYGLQAANILYRSGAEGVRNYTKAVDDNGAAQRFASTQLDNLAGDLEQLKGSIETALIKSGGNATVVLRGMAQGATGVVNSFAEIPGPLQAVGGGLATVTAATLLGFAAFAKLKPGIDQAITAFQNLTPAGQAAAVNLAKVAGVAAGLVIGATSISMIGDSAESTATGLLGMAAAGASIGAVFGPEGAAIGAVTGAIVGMGVAAVKTGDQLHGFAISVEQAAGSTNRELENMVRQMIFVGRAVGAIEKPADLADRALANIRDTAKGSLEAGTRLAEAYNNLGVITDAQLRNALEKAGSRQRDLNNDQAAGKAAADGLTGALGSAAGAMDNTASAADDLVTGLKDMNDALLDTYNKTFAAMHANESARDAIDNLNRTVNDANKTEEDRARALTSTQEAVLRSIVAAGELAEADHAAEGAAAAHTAGVAAQKAEFERLVGTLDPGSPLRQFLQGYIDRLNDIPPVKTTTISLQLDVSAWNAQLAALGLTQEQGAIMAAGGEFAPVTGAMAGGTFEAGTPLLVGEAGPEFFVTPARGTIIPNMAIKSRMRSFDGSQITDASVANVDQSKIVNANGWTVISPRPDLAARSTVARLRLLQMS